MSPRLSDHADTFHKFRYQFVKACVTPRTEIGTIHEIRDIVEGIFCLDLHRDETRSFVGNPPFGERGLVDPESRPLILGLNEIEWILLRVMERVIHNRVLEARVLGVIVAFGQQDGGSDVNRCAPALREQLALDLHYLDVLGFRWVSLLSRTSPAALES